MFMALVSQLVILLSTAVSYGFDIPSYFSEPMALNRQTDPIGFGPPWASAPGAWW